MKWASLHWFFACTLLLIALQHQKAWTWSTKPTWIQNVQNHFISKGSGSDASRFMATLFTGDKSRLRNKMKMKFKLLGLYHLFTPSGLHLTSLFLPLFFLLRRRSSKLLKFIAIILLLLPFTLEKFYSLKRMCIFHILKILFPGLSNRTIFILVFFIDFMRSGFSESPLSYALSFLFLGSIIFSKNFWHCLFMLFCSQMLVSGIFNDFFSPIGFLAGQILTTVFSALFPFLVLSTITFSGIDLIMSELFLSAINYTSVMISKTPVFQFPPLITFVLMGIFMIKHRLAPLLFALLILPSQLF